MNRVSTNQKQRAPVFWFTGLSGSGKSSLANSVHAILGSENVNAIILDGDDVRRTRHVNLGFSPEDIKTNNALIVDLCSQQRENCDAIFVPIISPYKESRLSARKRLQPAFYEIYICADLKTVIERDVKGLYEKAHRNEISNMIGYHKCSPYECPDSPDLLISTQYIPENECIRLLLGFVRPRISRRFHNQNKNNF